MELVSFAKEVLQNAAEHAASYSVGQTVLRYLDRALWIIEKSARWAVPPPLDQEERPQPELIRPLPWVLFFGLLIVLRITRESISVVNLIRGKPPLRSADVWTLSKYLVFTGTAALMGWESEGLDQIPYPQWGAGLLASYEMFSQHVTYIQSKRRYLRTLKYQGNRMMRARTEPATHESWYSHLQSLFEFTMCFRRQHYGNNNTQLSNGDEVLVVKRNKRGQKQASPVATTSETSMERLIEKMMADIEDSDECSDTLTNITNTTSEKSEYHTESDQDVANGSTCELDEETNINNEKFANTSIDNIDNETSEELLQMKNEIINTNSEPKDETFNFLLHEVYPHRDGASIHIKIANGRAAKEKNLSIEESLSDIESLIH